MKNISIHTNKIFLKQDMKSKIRMSIINQISKKNHEFFFIKIILLY